MEENNQNMIEQEESSIDFGAIFSAMKKYKGKYNRVVRQYVCDRLANLEDIRPDRIFITSAYCAREYVDVAYEEVSKLNYFKEILITEAACTVSSHCGPNTIGVLFIHK